MWKLVLPVIVFILNLGIVEAGSYCYYYNGSIDYCYYYYTVNIGGIVGGVIGGLIGLGVMITLIVVLCCCVCNTNRRQPGTIVQNPAGMTVVQTTGGYTNQGMGYPQQLGVMQQQGVYPQATAGVPVAYNTAMPPPAYPTGNVAPPPYEPQTK